MASRLQSMHGIICRYGVAVKDFCNPIIAFEGINQDFEIYDCLDDLFKKYHQEISIFLYRNLSRYLMNYKIRYAK